MNTPIAETATRRTSLGRHRPFEQQGQVVDLLLHPRVAIGFVIGDQPRRALEHRVHDAQFVGAQRTAGLGDLDDRIDEETWQKELGDRDHQETHR